MSRRRVTPSASANFPGPLAISRLESLATPRALAISSIPTIGSNARNNTPPAFPSGKHETFSDRFKGHSIFVSDGNLDPKDSLLFGSMLGQQLKARGLQYTPHYTESLMGRWRHTLLDADAGVYRYDTLFVLKKTQMPAVLLEAGSIVNRDEELALASPERQQLISAAVVDAVDSFCVAQSHKPALQIAQRSKARHVLSAHSHQRARGRAGNAAPLTAVSQSNLDIH